jgi:subtilase family serine protease
MFSFKVARSARIWRVLACCAILLTAIGGDRSAVGSASQSGALITEAVSDNQLVTLTGNTRPEATAANDRGPVATDFAMDHMLLQLRRTPEQEQEFEKYIDELENPKSSNYHHWLTATEVGERYGLAAQDLDKITGWLKSHGFKINRVYPNGMVIDFSGNAGQVHEAFHTEIHNLEVHGVAHVANMSDPKIPAALAPAVVGVVSLNDFQPQSRISTRPDFTFSCSDDPFTTTCNAVTPADLATIYNLNPLFTAGISGQGQTIVVIEESDVHALSDWTTFRSNFGLSSFTAGSVSQVHPASCTDPGVNGAEAEAILDAEWASASAPSAAIELASCTGTSATAGELLALENILNAKATPPAIVSNSYGEAEAINGATVNAAIASLYSTGVADGVSIFVASGDSAAAYADQGPVRNGDEEAASLGIAVNGSASTIFNVAVGGTDFSDVFAGTSSTYWSATNGTADKTALSYIPEIPWNGSCGSALIASFLGFPSTFGSSSVCNNGDGLDISGGGGGPSGCGTGTPSTTGVVSGTCAGYSKPSWQVVFGNPSDGVRDIPDLSLFASNGPWGHSFVICDSDSSEGGCITGFGGTSFAAPIMAGIQSLINQHTSSRQGNPNPTYYALAAAEYGASGSTACNSSLGNTVGSNCIFYDITQGDNDVPCTGTRNCYDPSGTFGVLSTSDSSFQPAYPATKGWDFATGIGSVNAENLVMAFGASATATPTATATSSHTATATPTATATATSGTPTATATHTATATATATHTATATATSTSGTPTATATHTATATATATRTATATATSTSGTPTATATHTATTTATATRTATPTATATGGSPTATATSTATQTATPTRTATPTPTSTPTGVPDLLKIKPASKNFGTVKVGKVKKETFTLSNSAKSGLPITFQTTLATSNNPQAFNFPAGATTCTPELLPKKKCKLTVQFTPSATGPVSGAITIFDNAANANQVIQVQGTGK